MGIDKIKRIVITQDVQKNENGKYVLDSTGYPIVKNKDIYIFNGDDIPIKEAYDENIHGAIFADYLANKNIDLNDDNALEQAEELGLFERCDTDDTAKLAEVEEEYQTSLNNFLSTRNSNDDDRYENAEEDKGLSKKAKAGITAGVAGLAAIAGIAAHTLNKENDVKEENEIFENKFYELMSKFEAGHPRRVFAESVFDTVKSMNLMTGKTDEAVYKTNDDGTKEYAFSLKEDISTTEDGKTKNEYLQFTFDEVMAAKLVLNNYSEEDLFKIFGEEQLDSQEIMNQYQKFASKIQLYYMNAKAPSGVASLIENQTNREWFQKLETSVIDFNKDLNQDNADKVIRTFEYLYEYDINGTDNVKINESSINTIKNLGFHIVTGYYNANAASKDYTKYLTIASAPGEFDEQFQTESLAQVQKGEKLKDILSRVEKGKCTMSLVQDQIDESIERLSKQQSETKSEDDIKEQYRASLVEILIDLENPELASRVLNETMSDELRELVRKEGKEAKNSLEAYDNSGSLNSLPSYTDIKTTADSILGPYADLNLTVIMVNRQRGKSLDLGKTDELISKEQWNKMSKSEQLDYSKKNGKVDSTKKTTTEVKVAEKDLTPSEKKEVEKQKEEINKDAIPEEDKDNTNMLTWRGKGYEDAVSYVKSNNGYKYNGKIVNTIPDTDEVIYENGKFVNQYAFMNSQNNLQSVASAAYAFNGVTITTSDSNIQARFANDVEKFKQNYSNVSSDAVESYKAGWLNGIQQELTSAIEQGKITRKDAEDAYAKAKEAASKKSVEETQIKNENKNEEPSTEAESYEASADPVTADPTPGTYNEDPNLDTSVDLPFIDDAGEGFHYNDGESYVAIDQSPYNNTEVIQNADSEPVVEESTAKLINDQKYYDVVDIITAALSEETSTVDEFPTVVEETSAPVLKK